MTENNLYIYKVSGFIYDTIKKPHPENLVNRGELAYDNGNLEIEYSMQARYESRITLSLPLVSVWIDRTNHEAPRICKAHAAVHRDDVTGKEVAAEMKKMKGVRFRSSGSYALSEFMLTSDDALSLVSVKSRRDYYAMISGGANMPFYDNKYQAFMSILETIKKLSVSSKIAGLDLIDFSSVDDKVLEEFGYTKVPDELGLGVDMWMGDAAEILTSGQVNTYSTFGSAWNSNYTERTMKMNQERKEIVESFLDVLEEALA